MQKLLQILFACLALSITIKCMDTHTVPLIEIEEVTKEQLENSIIVFNETLENLNTLEYSQYLPDFMPSRGFWTIHPDDGTILIRNHAGSCIAINCDGECSCSINNRNFPCQGTVIGHFNAKQINQIRQLLI